MLLAGAALAEEGAPRYPRQDRSRKIDGMRFVGSAACRPCHAEQFDAWSGSHHDRAMARATEDTVLGDFGDVRHTHQGVTSRMLRRGGRFFVNTDGPDGELADFEILYTFGVEPLQQYLVALPGGRLQALALAWDTRPKSSGGQRWFHLYPHEKLAAGDPLHWTGDAQNWNYMCADCHSTHLRRGYDADKRAFETTWAEIDVGCEACHGPGSAHLGWAKSPRADGEAGGSDEEPGDRSRAQLLVDLDLGSRRWSFAPGATIARTSSRADTAELRVCAPCHARRAALADGHTVGRPMEDAYRLSLLSEPLYHADGQIRDEVYVYGSFLQSRMHAAGVTCSDCHDPHTLALRASGNSLCAACHLRSTYDTQLHHFHADGEAGSACVDCHAPATTYMQVDDRRDHGFRVPRPDLSEAFGTPNPCTGCHQNQSAAWAVAAIAARGGQSTPAPNRTSDLTEALAAARQAGPGAEDRLIRLVTDAARPGIARATALRMLAPSPSPRSSKIVAAAAMDDDALVRREAAAALAYFPADVRTAAGFRLLTDPFLSVRLDAAASFADVDERELDRAQRETLRAAFAEYVETQTVLAERPESLTNLGNFYRQRGDTKRAETRYRRAIQDHPSFIGAYINLADLYRSRGDERDAREVLAAAVAREPSAAGAQHALGLSLVRAKRYDEAATPLGEAARLAPEHARYGLVYALCLERLGRLAEAVAALRTVHTRHPHDREILLTLATMSRDHGDRDRALEYARSLAELTPEDPRARALVEQLEGDR